MYRVIQEALTNTVKHAAGARTTIGLTYGPADIRVEVANDAPPGGGAAAGRPSPGPTAALPEASPGHGILGMRERVSAFGGTLTAGPVNGGFRVRVRVPLREGA